MPTVYVVEEPLMRDPLTGDVRPKFSLRSAERYGKLAYLLSWSDKTRCTPDELVWRLRDKLRGIQPGDYLLTTGSPQAIAVATTVAIDLNDGRINLLSWDRETRSYELLELDLDCDRPARRTA